jgi:hypothetical protein
MRERKIEYVARVTSIAFMILLLLLASCTSSPGATVTPTPPSYINEEREGGSLGGVWYLEDIDCQIAPEASRIAFQMREMSPGQPYYRVVEVYNDQVLFPSQPDRSEHDPSWGEARIDLLVSDLYGYEYDWSELPLACPESPAVIKVGHYPTYDDAILGFSIGLKRAAPYQVTTLEDPVRLVVEVQTE